MQRPERVAGCLLALALAAAQAAATEPAPPRYSAPITVAGTAPFVRVAMPPSVYAHSLQADLRDLRVVDARGQRVPFAFLAPPPAQASEQLRDATLYPLPPRPAGNATWPSPVDVTVDGDRITVHRSGAGAAAPSAFPGASPGWLIDLGAPRPGEVPYRLRLAWSGPAEFSTGYTLETSDDLRNWRSGPGGQLMALQSTAGSLAQPFVVLPAATGRFLRLVWLDTSSVPVVTGATAFAPAPGVVAADLANELVFATSAEPVGRAGLDAAARRALYFDLGGDLPLRDVDLRFAGGTQLVPARVQGRSRADEPWRDLGAAVFYRLERDGTVAESPGLALASRVRFLRIVPDERAGMPDVAKTQLVVHASLASLVFATTGEPPFRLLAGSADASEGALPLTTLVPQLEQERSRFGRGEVGAFSEEPEVARAAERAQQFARLRPWLLWSVLLVGVLALATLVWRLARDGGAPEAPNP